MKTNTNQCFDQTHLKRLLNEQLDADEESITFDHLGHCQSCQSNLAGISGRDDIVGEIRKLVSRPSNRSNMKGTCTDLISQRPLGIDEIKQVLAPTDDPSMLGRLGAYEVIAVIGHGSTGIVVKARDPALNRNVAIKLLAPSYRNNGTARRRFEREARAVAAVTHENVVPIHSVGESLGIPYFVMQYFPGGSLQQRIEKQGPFETCEVVRIGMQIAKGLAEAHKQGIVHRDVKPANVLLENDVDRAMVSDFGLARIGDDASITRTGTISGTPQFMSPEQAKGEMIDQRSDLFSLGSVMYNACTGHAPFRSETVFGVIKRVCESDPRPIREVNPNIDSWLVRLIAKLHAKSPGDRFQSAEQVAEALSSELAHLQSPTIVTEPKRDWLKVEHRSTSIRKSLGFGLLATSLVAIALFVGWNSGFFNGQPGNATNGNSGSALVAGGTQEELAIFTKQFEKTIDVENGGTLFLRSNLGKVKVTTHDDSTVKLNLTCELVIKNEKAAKKLFKHIALRYDLEDNELQDIDLVDGRDALIVVEFPDDTLDPDKIDAIEDMDQLKELLLVHNSKYHFRKVQFELRVPKNFNLNLKSSAGTIEVPDMNGSVKLRGSGGWIETGAITGTVEVKGSGGHINTGDIGGSATIKVSGGHIQTGNVGGPMTARTSGGHISLGIVEGDVIAHTSGGRIYVVHVKGKLDAKTSGGQIKADQVDGSVQAKTTSGSIKVNIGAQPQEDSTMTTSIGSITIGLVDGLSLDIVAKTEKGKVSGKFVDGKPSQISQALNGGGHQLFASTGSGPIRFEIPPASHKTETKD